MYRHLERLQGKWEIHRAHPAPPLPGENHFHELPLRSLYRSLAKSRYRRWVEGIDMIVGVSVSDRVVKAVIDEVRPDVILQVVEGSLPHSVRRAAASRSIPVISVYHDWAPLFVDMPGKLRPIADRRFAGVARDCAATLCISEELRDAIPCRGERIWLPPIPDAAPLRDLPGPVPGDFHAAYAGVFHYFHSTEIVGLCSELNRRNLPGALRLYGLEPDWSSPAMEPVRSGGFYHGLLKGRGFQEALGRASALLVVKPFDRYWTNFARYSLSSKITEYCRYGKPIVIWAPENAADVAWARRTGAAWVVTGSDPSAVADALAQIQREPERARKAAALAKEQTDGVFHPDRLQRIFEDSLTRAVSRRRQGAHRSAPQA
jgi:glycosyltransferase involved in cell wall biosynthesis